MLSYTYCKIQTIIRQKYRKKVKSREIIHRSTLLKSREPRDRLQKYIAPYSNFLGKTCVIQYPCSYKTEHEDSSLVKEARHS